jgi:hypothetical protein
VTDPAASVVETRTVTDVPWPRATAARSAGLAVSGAVTPTALLGARSLITSVAPFGINEIGTRAPPAPLTATPRPNPIAMRLGKVTVKLPSAGPPDAVDTLNANSAVLDETWLRETAESFGGAVTSQVKEVCCWSDAWPETSSLTLYRPGRVGVPDTTPERALIRRPGGRPWAS